MSADFFYEQGIVTKGLPSTSVFGIPAPSTTQAYPIGQLLTNGSTGALLKYVQASGVIAIGDVVSSSDASGYLVVKAPATAAGVAARSGVAPQAFTDLQFGFIVVHGPVLVNATGAGYVLGDPVAPDVGATGKVIEHTVANPPTQAEVVRDGAIMGYALAVEAAGQVSIFVNRCL